MYLTRPYHTPHLIEATAGARAVLALFYLTAQVTTGEFDHATHRRRGNPKSHPRTHEED
jgi:hypothetical protein